MKIVFIADLHFSGQVSGGISLNYQQPVYSEPLDLLLKSLKNRYNDENGKLSHIVFLGDYIIGKTNTDQKRETFNKVKEFADKVISEAPDVFVDSESNKDRIIFIEGNHDVERNENHHQIFQEIFANYITPFTTKQGNEIRKFGAPIFEYESDNAVIACISTTANAGAHYALADQLQNDLQENHPKAFESVKKILEKLQNSDVGSVTNETIELFSSIIDSEEFSKNASENIKYCILVSHHPLLPVQTETANHFNTINGYGFLRKAMSRGFNYFISGHLHEFSFLEITDKNEPNEPLHGNLIGVPKFLTENNTIQFVELNLQETGYTCSHLRFNKLRDCIEEIKCIFNNKSLTKNNADKYDHILLDYELKEIISLGEIVKNGSTDRVEAASYDCALGYFYKRYDKQNETWAETAEELKENVYGPAKISIEPQESILIYTYEEFDIPHNMMLQASPRASWIRKNLHIDISFFVEPGFRGQICFPVTNKSQNTLEINAQEAVLSLVFHRLSSDVHLGWRDRHKNSSEIREMRQDT
jgi:deoxycytidine triphosphate deaminase